MNESLETDQPSRLGAKGDPDQVLKLVEEWLAEDDGYDAIAWPVIAKDIEENRLSGRSRFSHAPL